MSPNIPADCLHDILDKLGTISFTIRLTVVIPPDEHLSQRLLQLSCATKGGISATETKDDVLYEYSLPEVKLLYKKIIQEKLAQRADFIEDVIAGIGGALGGKKAFRELKPMTETEFHAL